jgi:hypothetical protein
MLQANRNQYQGDLGPIIQTVLSFLSGCGRIITLIFLIRLFFVDAFSWYVPIIIAIIGEVANIVLLTPLFVLIVRRNFLILFVVHVLSAIGLVSSLFFQAYFFHSVAK